MKAAIMPRKTTNATRSGNAMTRNDQRVPVRSTSLPDCTRRRTNSVGDLAVGELLWSNLRGVIYSVAFLAVMLAFGLVASPLALLAPFAVIFIGFAFGAAGFAITTHMRSWKDFDFIFIVLTPLFLFSATFYPVEIYPGVLRYVVELSPLTRGTHLIRSLVFGDLNLLMLADIGFLALIGFLGYRHAVSRLGKLLLK